ncbi:hypothetical protein GWK47_017068 [Chionoecetes opilio]|uniref:Uncharacterized protein n=1 Tax=Chionoecetes opilio TaxID=41210 RepID=A0A8J5CM81_CHIOP|nr:hypothetical protein GWK47_017068 [Chionoecetes opilio]
MKDLTCAHEYEYAVNQSIIGAYAGGRVASPHPYDAIPGSPRPESPCRLLFHTKRSRKRHINLSQPRALWAPPLASSTPDCPLTDKNPMGRDRFQGSVPHVHIAEVALTDYAGDLSPKGFASSAAPSRDITRTPRTQQRLLQLGKNMIIDFGVSGQANA